LITRSARVQAVKKLTKLGIRPEIFNFTSFGDDPHALHDTFAKNFQYFLSISPHQPSEHVYIGDDPRMDVIPPRNLGMRTILVGKDSKDADFSISNIYGIRGLLLS
jgi:FMN phosphatase YigB (HAD superfamily)